MGGHIGLVRARTYTHCDTRARARTHTNTNTHIHLYKRTRTRIHTLALTHSQRAHTNTHINTRSLAHSCTAGEDIRPALELQLCAHHLPRYPQHHSPSPSQPLSRFRYRHRCLLYSLSRPIHRCTAAPLLCHMLAVSWQLLTAKCIAQCQSQNFLKHANNN